MPLRVGPSSRGESNDGLQMSNTLSLKDVFELLGAPAISGEQWQVERLRQWVASLVETRGKDYVWEHRRELLTQWEQHATGKFKSCL